MTMNCGFAAGWWVVAASLTALAVLSAWPRSKGPRLLLALLAAAWGALAAPVPTTAPQDAGMAFVATARKGAVGANVPARMAALGVDHGYNYVPYSKSQDVTPMLKRKHIQMLRGDRAETCSPGYDLCPSLGIARTIATRGTGGYWLIFNEPGGEDGYQNEGGVTQAAHDACFAIRYIKQRDPTARFILGYHNDIASQWGWPSVAAQYGLDTDINRVISGWHLHIYDGSQSVANLDTQLKSFRDAVLRFKSTVMDTITPGKELWITEFGTLMRRSVGETLWCDDLGLQAGCECRFDRIDSDPDQTCVRYMQEIVGWLESGESPVNRYYWWNYGPPAPQSIITHFYLRDQCYGALSGTDGQLNNLGRAFAAIGSSPGPSTPTATRTATGTPATPTPTRTATETPTPAPCTLLGSVTLQRLAGPPHPSWVTALTVTVGAASYAVTTSPSGAFTLGPLTPGTYSIRVKSRHSLANRRPNVTLNPGANAISFGALEEGDANDDNCVDMDDFYVLKETFNTADPRADFNQDGVVNLLDFYAMKWNLMHCGDWVVSGP